MAAIKASPRTFRFPLILRILLYVVCLCLLLIPQEDWSNRYLGSISEARSTVGTSGIESVASGLLSRTPWKTQDVKKSSARECAWRASAHSPVDQGATA